MNRLILLFCLISSIGYSQTIKPICDETLQIPYSFTYSGFIIQDADIIKAEALNLRLDFVRDSIDGILLYSENFVVPYSGSSFFTVEIGTVSDSRFLFLLSQMNENVDTPYFIEAYLKNDTTNDYEFIGAKNILTVPYAMVSNALGGLGPVGPQGAQGAQGDVGGVGIACLPGFDGDQGPQGADGIDGQDNFGTMLMTNVIPTSQSVYIDDGTNTEDGLPHIRYKLNGVWIDL